jgi:hypothetical protein
VKGIFDDIANSITSLFDTGGPAVDGAGAESLGIVPDHCWYRGEKYECALSMTCAIAGKKSMDLCNGGLIWTWDRFYKTPFRPKTFWAHFVLQFF